jgi:hypothetical protein
MTMGCAGDMYWSNAITPATIVKNATKPATMRPPNPEECAVLVPPAITAPQ